MHYEIDLAYTWNEETASQFEKIDDKLREITGKYSDSSGAGFGTRDHQYWFDTYDEAKEAHERLIMNTFIALQYCNLYEAED